MLLVHVYLIWSHLEPEEKDFVNESFQKTLLGLSSYTKHMATEALEC
jgi:hypothetical protein